MAPEANWQTKGGEHAAGTETSASDQQSVEALIRRLIARVEESERRYSEALDDLHARLDQLSQTTEALPTSGSAEETETLERLRRHLSNLTGRREQPKAPAPGFNELAKLDQALAEARRAAAGLGSGFASAPPPFPSSSPFNGTFFAPPFSGATPVPPVEPLSNFDTHKTADLDCRLVEMANRLERSIEQTNAKAAVEILNARMDDLARRFEAAMSGAPGAANLKLLERQVTDIGLQVGRVEQQLERINMVETELHRLIDRFEGTPAQVAEAASKAANEAARLVAESGSALTAAQRLDAIHRDLIAMNERSRATDDRVVDTLAAVHESLKGLVSQLERGNRATQAHEDASPRPPLPAPAMPEVHSRPGFTFQPRRPGMPPFAAESLKDRATLREEGPESDAPSERPLRNRFRDLDAGIGSQEGSGHAKRRIFDEPDLDDDEAQPRPFARPLDREAERDSIDDLVAAARRASQAAAARAEERAQLLRPARGSKEARHSIGTDVRERKKRSFLIIAAALLLVVSAALLYWHLQSKPWPGAMPPAAEQTVPAPASETAPATTGRKGDAEPVPTDVLPDLPPVRELKPAPNTTPDPAPRPSGVQPHSTTPSVIPGASEPPPVTLSEAPVVVGALGASSFPGVSVIGKTASVAPDSGPMLQPASLRSEEGPQLPASIAAFKGASVIAPRLPLPAAEIGTMPLREAAASGDPRAQYIVGIRYSQPHGTAKTPNWTEVARWLSLAASAGLAPAQYRLAVLYERGDGVTKDLGLAKSWYARAAEQGNVKAMHNLAVAASRESDTADYALAAQWYREAASYGLADSQFNLGVLAEHGFGIQKDLAAAYRWFSLAAAQSRDVEAITRRDRLRAALSTLAAAEADAAVAAWRAKPAKPEANQVVEEASWRLQPASPSRDEIVMAQELLNRLGYQVGPADGEAGARTSEAIKAFELRLGMDQTGEITGALLAKLQAIAG